MSSFRPPFTRSMAERRRFRPPHENTNRMGRNHRQSTRLPTLLASEIWFLRASEAVVPPLEGMFAIRVYILPKLQAYMQSSMFKNPASRTAWHVKSVIWASSTMKSTSGDPGWYSRTVLGRINMPQGAVLVNR
jgi:hypothetical protein